MTSTKVLKPFDLEAAKRGEPIMMADGTPCKFLMHVPETKEVYVLAFRPELEQGYCVYNINGNGMTFVGPRSLVMAPKKTTLWVNVYRNHSGKFELGTPYFTEERAIDQTIIGLGTRIQTVSIEIEE